MTAVGVPAPLTLRDGGLRLPLSDLVVVGLFSVVLFVALDPFAWRLLTRGLGRWGPFAVGIPLVALAVFGRLLGRLQLPADVRREARSLLWPTVAFGLLVLSGSLYGRWIESNDHTFMPMGLFTLVGAPVTAWLVLTSANPQRLLATLAWIFYGLALFAVLTTATIRSGIAVFHSVEFLVFPVLVLPFLCARGWTLRLLGVVGLVAAAVVLDKLTGYLVALLVVALLSAAALRSRLQQAGSSLQRIALAYWAALSAMVVLIAIAAAYYLAKGRLPTGNAQYRLHTYGKAFDRFLDSPAWGSLFTDPPVERFELFSVAAVTQVLPTHNDTLDILAHGGVLGAALFAIAIGVLLVAALGALADDARFEGRSRLRAQLGMHTMVLICAIPVFTLNPVLNTHNRAWSFWINAGLIVASVILSRRPSGWRIERSDAA